MSRNASRVRHIQIITPEEELENLRNEVGALKRTVESKSAAVNILRAELQECQKERDKFRTLVEDETLHRSAVSSVSKKAAYSDPCRSAMLSGSEGTLAQLLSLSKEENKTLRLESTELRCKLHDAQADIKVLREEIQRLKGGESRRRSLAHTATSQLAHQEREQFISQMEALSSRCQALEGDVRGLVEEREELVRELDASSHKLHRLNHILNTILSSAPSTSSVTHHPKRLIDLDAIITENRYLQERVKQTEEEKNLARSNASKYKAALEKSRTQGSIKLGSSENLIVTPKQVGELLRDYRGEVDGAAETDLRSLCVALVDALNQRSRALRTQRSANKVLVTRVVELERRLSNIGNSKDSNTDYSSNADNAVPQITSLVLMEGYVPPSGPIPKYSEEDTMKDPRLTQLLNSGLRIDTATVEKEVCKESQSNYQQQNIECDSTNDNKLGEGDSLTNTNASNTNEEVHEVVKDESEVSKTIHDNANSRIPEREQNQELCNHCHGNEGKVRKTETIEDDMGITVNNEHPPCRKVIERSDKSSRNKCHEIKSGSTSPSDDVKDQYTKQRKLSTYINPEDELEEIVPIDQLDLYIREIQERRKSSKIATSTNSELNTQKEDVNNTPEVNSVLEEIDNQIEKEVQTTASYREAHVKKPQLSTEDNDSSFDLDISDYDSDNDNLDLALQDWQNDFDKKFSGKKKKKKIAHLVPKDSNQKGTSKKDRFGFWQKDSSIQETPINPALQEFLDKATAAAVDNGVNIP